MAKLDFLSVDEIKVGDRHRKDLGDIESLRQSIDQLGLLHPIVVDQERNLIAGRRRLEACKQLGHNKIRCSVAFNLNDAVMHLSAERDENTCRKDFTPSEAVAIGKALEKLEKPKAEERMVSGKGEGGSGGRGNKKPSGNFPEGNVKGKEVRDIIGEAVGMSGRTYQKAKAVIERAEADPEGFAEVVEEMDRSGKVSPAYAKVMGHANGKKGTKDTPKDPPPGQSRGVGIERAHEAIACLKRIPKNDALRKRGFQVVTDWIRHNK